MTVAELLSQMASHMIEGMMVHEQLMNSYRFLNLPGYSAIHEYHYLSETCGYIRLCAYAVNHFDIIIPSDGRQNIPKIIPPSWRESARMNVTPKVRRESMENGFSEWVKWEEQTKELYEGLYKEAIDSKFVPLSEFIKGYILDVEGELVFAKNELISKRAIDFDIVSILEEQSELEKTFRKKIKKIGEEIHENE